MECQTQTQPLSGKVSLDLVHHIRFSLFQKYMGNSSYYSHAVLKIWTPVPSWSTCADDKGIVDHHGVQVKDKW